MTQKLPNFLSGQWQTGTGAGTPLFDPVLGTELVQVDATGLDLAAGFAFAREQGGSALRALTYRQRASMLAAAVKVLQANRDAYNDIATANSGTVKNDTAVDVDGGIFTLGTYAKLGLVGKSCASTAIWRARIRQTHHAAPGSEAFDLFAKEVAREMTVKSGQKCTAIRRALVPEVHYSAAAQAISARLPSPQRCASEQCCTRSA